MNALAIPFFDYFHLVLGRPATEDDVVILLGTRLDESGTDGNSKYAVVAGAISFPDAWDKLEASWQNLLDRSRVRAFHAVDFGQHKGDFKGWSDLKRKRFVAAQDKILGRQTAWEIAVAIDRKAHTEIKKEMRGVKGFTPDSDCGMCFRVALALACEQVAERNSNFQMAFMIEAGPWASNANVIFDGVVASEHSGVPALHARHLAGLAVVPKGVRRSLEAADYIAGIAQELAEGGRLITRPRPRMCAALLDYELLQDWHKGMFTEKKRRAAFFHRAQTSGELPA